MDFITLCGAPAGRIGQGTWELGVRPERAAQECDALRAGIEAGMTLLDTAEMYGEGAAEELLGQAIRGFDRERLYLVSKVYPHNAGRQNIFQCCEDSLRRMGTDYLDLYLLHWRGAVPLAETVECMEELKARGRIRAWGVSNLDRSWMEDLFRTDGGDRCLTDQVLYHLGSRGVEYDLLPWLQQHQLPLMAYCPLAQGGSLRQELLGSPAVQRIARTRQASPCQVLLAFLLAQPGVVPIPRSSSARHTLDNAAALDLRLTAEELGILDKAFPAPDHPTPLDVV